MMKILLTCPPMIKRINEYEVLLKKYNLDIVIPEFVQTVPENRLIEIIGDYDGWIIGDDVASRAVFEAGKRGKLKAAVKWGVGIDNVDIQACKEIGIPISHTPGMFGDEVANVALGYLLGLARDTYMIHEGVKRKEWLKPSGISLTGKKVCLVGFGNIGRRIARRLVSLNMKIYVSDPVYIKHKHKHTHKNENDAMGIDNFFENIIRFEELNECLRDADFIVIACVLNKSTHYLINYNNIRMCNKGVRIVNVSRGPIINESDVIRLLDEGFIHGVAFDVYENEPIQPGNRLLEYPTNIFGTHNGSNTTEAVDLTSIKVIELMNTFMNTFMN